MNDTGLCCRAQDILYNDVMFSNPLLNNFLGGLTENYVYTQLRSNGYEPYYWTIGSQAEVDFVIPKSDIRKKMLPASDATQLTINFEQ